MPAVLVSAAILKLAFGICIVASPSLPAVREEYSSFPLPEDPSCVSGGNTRDSSCLPSLPDYDPCCAFPCQNGGVCLASGSSFQCDCTGTGYFGRTCQRATWYQWFQNNLCRKGACTWLVKYSPVSNVVNKVDRLHNRVMKSIYLGLTVSIPATKDSLYQSPQPRTHCINPRSQGLTVSIPPTKDSLYQSPQPRTHCINPRNQGLAVSIPATKDSPYQSLQPRTHCINPRNQGLTVSIPATKDSPYQSPQPRTHCINPRNQGLTVSIPATKDSPYQSLQPRTHCINLSNQGLTVSIPPTKDSLYQSLQPRTHCINLSNQGLTVSIPATKDSLYKYLQPRTQWTPLLSESTHHSALAGSFPLYISPWDYTTLDAYFNQSHYTRALPPIPRNCPKAMGVTGHHITGRWYSNPSPSFVRPTWAPLGAGPSPNSVDCKSGDVAGPVMLPSIDEVFELLLESREFIPEPRHTNLLFVMYAQHFGLQFLQTDGSVTAHGVRDRQCSQGGPKRRNSGFLIKSSLQVGSEDIDPKRAMGHRVLSASPLLFVVATIWTREHNRVCRILHEEHPSWDDERLYQTARLVVTGVRIVLITFLAHNPSFTLSPWEMLKVTLEDFMQHLTQYRVYLKYRPELLRGTSHQYGYRVSQEFNLLHLWLTMLPDQIKVIHKTYNMADLLNSNNRIVLEHTFDGFVETLVHTNAGKPKHRNHGKALSNIGKAVIKRARQLHLQSFNNYRRKFRLLPYTSFQELVGDPALAKKLEDIYVDIEALELYPGECGLRSFPKRNVDRSMFASVCQNIFSKPSQEFYKLCTPLKIITFVTGLLLEKAGKAIVPPTMLALSSHWIVTAILSNPIGSPDWWKPSTLGGEVGMSIVKKATLERLFCQNMKSQCRSLEVIFTVPKSKSTEIGPYLGAKNDPNC
uniref:prostaglandin-endoperoxide synthase n=1 Tax=Timema tahoe TaxID=61484 RepID=A0A7R9FF75_9NEOP|nr:unnamed protein product [Timema tahoe]